MRVRFDKIDGFIEIYDETSINWCWKIWCNLWLGLIYIISKKSGIKYINSQNFVNIKVDSYDSLPRKNIVTFHDIIILIKSVFNQDKNHYYYNIFLDKASYKLRNK